MTYCVSSGTLNLAQLNSTQLLQLLPTVNLPRRCTYDHTICREQPRAGPEFDKGPDNKSLACLDGRWSDRAARLASGEFSENRTTMATVAMKLTVATECHGNGRC